MRLLTPRETAGSDYKTTPRVVLDNGQFSTACVHIPNVYSYYHLAYCKGHYLGAILRNNVVDDKVNGNIRLQLVQQLQWCLDNRNWAMSYETIN